MPTQEPEDYSIRRLAEKAGVSVRTIRFYMDEGLLNTPPVKGRYTVYSDEYLDRLELIRRLKESYLPLKEIRQRMNSLSWEEVKTALAQPRQQEAAQPRMVREQSNSALEYITQVLHRPPGAASPARLSSTLPHVAETWERVALADGLELHIRQPVSLEDRLKLKQVIDFACNLFQDPR